MCQAKYYFRQSFWQILHSKIHSRQYRCVLFSACKTPLTTKNYTFNTGYCMYKYLYKRNYYKYSYRFLVYIKSTYVTISRRLFDVFIFFHRRCLVCRVWDHLLSILFICRRNLPTWRDMKCKYSYAWETCQCGFIWNVKYHLQTHEKLANVTLYEMLTTSSFAEELYNFILSTLLL